MQEWQTLKVSSDNIISPTRSTADPYRLLIFNKHKNYYFSKNPLIEAKDKRNATDNLRGISLIMIDIDNENKYGKDVKKYIQDKERLQRKINDLINKGKLPMYTTFVFSGTGVQLFYEIEQVSPNAKELVKEISKAIIKTIQNSLDKDKSLKMYGVDSGASNNVVGWARLGGINLKSGLAVTRNHTDIKYTLKGLQSLTDAKNTYTPIQRLKTSAEVRTSQEIKPSYVARHRAKVAENIRDLKQARGEVVGFRNYLLFMYTNQIHQLHEKEKAKQGTIAFNNQFIKPLKETEVSKLIDQANKRIYLYKNDTLDEFMLDKKGLNLTRQELIEVKKTGRIKRKRKTIEQEIKRSQRIVKLLKDENLNNKQIADILKVSDRTVRNYRAKYNIPNPFTN